MLEPPYPSKRSASLLPTLQMRRRRTQLQLNFRYSSRYSKSCSAPTFLRPRLQLPHRVPPQFTGIRTLAPPMYPLCPCTMALLVLFRAAADRVGGTNTSAWRLWLPQADPVGGVAIKPRARAVEGKGKEGGGAEEVVEEVVEEGAARTPPAEAVEGVEHDQGCKTEGEEAAGADVGVVVGVVDAGVVGVEVVGREVGMPLAGAALRLRGPPSRTPRTLPRCRALMTSRKVPRGCSPPRPTLLR